MREAHFPRQEGPRKRHNDCLTYHLLDLAVPEGLMSRKRKKKAASISLLVCPSWTRQHTEVVIMINQLACFLILAGLQHEGRNSSHATGIQDCVHWKPRSCQK